MGLEAARKLVQRFRVGSGSNNGIPVADVVVLQVLVDILLNMLGAIGLLPLCVDQIQENIYSREFIQKRIYSEKIYLRENYSERIHPRIGG